MCWQILGSVFFKGKQQTIKQRKWLNCAWSSFKLGTLTSYLEMADTVETNLEMRSLSCKKEGKNIQNTSATSYWIHPLYQHLWVVNTGHLYCNITAITDIKVNCFHCLYVCMCVGMYAFFVTTSPQMHQSFFTCVLLKWLLQSKSSTSTSWQMCCFSYLLLSDTAPMM